jgi:hypothetical protein
MNDCPRKLCFLDRTRLIDCSTFLHLLRTLRFVCVQQESIRALYSDDLWILNLKPNRPKNMAEGEGFEPSIRFCRIHDFQSCAFNRSATLPYSHHCKSFVSCQFLPNTKKSQTLAVILSNTMDLWLSLSYDKNTLLFF